MQPEEIGLDKPKGKKWCEVPVPMPWSAFLLRSSGVPSRMVPDRMAWFRRRLIVPDIPPTARLVLHFEAVNFYGVVFVNGKRCGEHVGDALPFGVDITDFVVPGHGAEILVGVQDISFAESPAAGRSRARRGRKLMYPGLPHQPGIWGDVSLRVIPELHIVSVRVDTTLPGSGTDRAPLAEGRIHVTVTVKNETGRALGFSLTNEVYDGARQAVAFAPIRGVIGAGELTGIDMGTSWGSAVLWWPDQPHLYTLRTALWSSLPGGGSEQETDSVGEVVDRVHTPVGFRDFRIDGDQFKLNNVPVQLRSEALCPISAELFSRLPASAAAHPVAPEQAREILSALKRERELNTVRFHRLPPSPALLQAADEVGLLVVVELPLPDDELRYAVERPAFWANTEDLARQWVAAHAHHPSIVMWSIDQGMVRRYGRGVIEGLRSLARAVADVDPTRPVETACDAGLVDTRDLLVSSPVSVPFVSTGVAFRTTGKYEPDGVRDRVLALPAPPDSSWLPERPADRPLCAMEHARRPLTPGALAFLLGDGAYAPGVDLDAAAAPLAALEMGACRITGFAGIHTVGRPPGPPGTTGAAGEVAALPAGLCANFYAGTRLVEDLVLRNDTRFDQDFDLVCGFTTADGGSEESEQLFLAAGTKKEKAVAFELPDIRQVYDAEGATSVLAELRVDLTGNRAGSFTSRRKIAIWPHVRATRPRHIGLYDPDGQTAAALSAVGAKYSAARGAPHGEFDTIIVGENALDQGSPPDPEVLRTFVAKGGLAIVLAQSRMPYDLSPVTLVLDEGRAATVTFVRDGEHPLLRGLSSFEMRWWQDDHRVATGCLHKPAWGNFRCLVDAGGPGGLRWAAAVEVFHGRGSCIFSQMDLVRKTARAPVAGLLLARLADAVVSWRPVRAAALEGERTFTEVGARGVPVPRDFAGPDLENVRVVLLTGDNLAGLSPGRRRLLREWVDAGGCLYVHDLVPGQEKPAAAVAGRAVGLVESPQPRLVFNRPGAGLARGLSSADLCFVDHGARYSGEVPRPVYAASTVVTVNGDVTGVASTVDSPVEYGLVALRSGRGRVVLDQVRWDVETAADSRAGRYVSTLLTNLGVPLDPPRRVVPSARARRVDISAACNTTWVDHLPGDGEGWTDRGPDNDLRALSPGLMIADGVPFRVGPPGGRGRDCCVLGPAGDAAAPPIDVGCRAQSLGFLVACEGQVGRGQVVADFTVRYVNGLETQVPLRFGVDVLDWNERGRDLGDASLAWKGFTALGEPAAVYAKRWENNRPGEPIQRVTFSSTRAGATPILLAMTALL